MRRRRRAGALETVAAMGWKGEELLPFEEPAPPQGTPEKLLGLVKKEALWKAAPLAAAFAAGLALGALRK